MALTWQGTKPRQITPGASEKHQEGPEPVIDYLIRRMGSALSYEVQMPAQSGVKFPVEIAMGGQRHGVSFLARVHDLNGSVLARAPLIETRYLHYAPEGRLELSPGFPRDKPTNYETALGRVLTPQFEKKCLSCHGEPRREGTHVETGVSCESCHGPGQGHLAALAGKSSDKGILNPHKLPVADQMQPCSQCHAGFSKVQDPMPDDLLISDQVTALSNSECWRQSGGQITCVNCHNPHSDAPGGALVEKSEKTCVGCHGATVADHPALCPVNRTSGCVGCHMPEQQSSPPFLISDHWIRVHPEKNVPVPAKMHEWKSRVTPKYLFIRLVVLDDATKAAAVRQQLESGASFFDLARANSLDRATGMNGGYLGDVKAGDLDPAWSAAALTLAPGGVSPVVESRGKHFIVGRMPRNFREEAEALFNQAMDERKAGRREQSVAGLLDALKIYPQLLRALTFLGISSGEGGNPQAAAGVLSLATRLYPQDAGARFNLGIAYGAIGKDEELAQYKEALAIDPDYVPAYLNWGASLFAKGSYNEAIDVYRRGIAINPLVASLHYSLGLALERANQVQEAQQEMALAAKIDPDVSRPK